MRTIYIALVALIAASCSEADKTEGVSNGKTEISTIEDSKFCEGIINNQLDSIIEDYREYLIDCDEGSHSEDKIFIQFLGGEQINEVIVSSSPGFPYLMDSSLVIMSFNSCSNLFVIDKFEQTSSRHFYLRTETTKDFARIQPDHGSYNDVGREKRTWNFTIESNSRLRRID